MYDPEMRNVMTMATVKALAYEDQDRADGAALRRLREALPEGYGFDLSATQGDGDGHPYSAAIWNERGDELGDPMRAWYPTIAEAADACREALPKVPA